MHRIDGDGNVDNLFVEGNPATGQEATQVTDDWLNAVQEEIAAVIEAAGLTLDKEDNAQLLAAVMSILSSVATGPALAVNVKDTDEVLVSGKGIEINGQNYILGSSFYKQFTGLSNGYNAVYVKAPAAGNTITADEIEASTSMPTLSYAKGGWYDATGEKKAIGFIYVASGAIQESYLAGRWVVFPNPRTLLDTTSPATSATAISAGVPAVGRLRVLLGGCVSETGSSTGVFLYIFDGDAAGSTWTPCVLAEGPTGTNWAARGEFTLHTDLSGQVKYKAKAATNWAFIAMHAFELPWGM